MKVKCIALLNADGKPVEFSPWLTLGKIYHVLAISTDRSGTKRFQIVASDRGAAIESLGFHLAACFEVVSQYRPSSWVDRRVNGGLETSPISWQVEDFWEALYEGDPDANLVFERERSLIHQEEP